MDTSYVDEEFKKETPKDTPDVASNTLRQKVKFGMTLLQCRCLCYTVCL
jgi:hypothetical protein